MQLFVKDPDSVLDYKVDWSSWLGTDTISTSRWVVQSGITEDSDSNDTTSATSWLSGGTEGSTYTVTNRIDTAGGRTADRTFKVLVQTR